MKFLICPDSFKESLSSKEAVDIMRLAINDHYSETIIQSVVMADGGEGSLDAIEAIKDTKRKYVNTFDANGRAIESYYLIAKDEVFIEMANSVGLALIEKENRDILNTSSRGLGVLIKDAIKTQKKTINIFIGGSATNDAGVGAMSELGVRFFDEDGVEIKDIKTKDLSRIKSIDVTKLKSLIKSKTFVMLSDVTNPLVGDNGATKIYSSQKGASAKEVDLIEDAMISYSIVVKEQLGIRLPNMKCAGAAGGMGSALIAYLNSKVLMGADFILDINHFEKQLDDVDIIFTGEGKYDLQSRMGKVVSAIASRAGGKKVVVFCGVEEGNSSTESLEVVSIKPKEYSLKRSIEETRQLLYKAVSSYIKEIL